MRFFGLIGCCLAFSACSTVSVQEQSASQAVRASQGQGPAKVVNAQPSPSTGSTGVGINSSRPAQTGRAQVGGNPKIASTGPSGGPKSPGNKNPSDSAVKSKADSSKVVDPVDIAPVTEDFVAVGYASIAAQPSSDPAEKRLQAIRASKIDAYRALAEQVFGIQLTLDSRAADGRLVNETIRSKSTGLIQGAEIISIEPLNNDSYQVTLRLRASDVNRARKAAPNLTALR